MPKVFDYIGEDAKTHAAVKAALASRSNEWQTSAEIAAQVDADPFDVRLTLLEMRETAQVRIRNCAGVIRWRAI